MKTEDSVKQLDISKCLTLIGEVIILLSHFFRP